MNPGIKRTAFAVILLALGLGIGIWLGSHLGYRLGASDVATISINTQVHDIDNRVQALTALRTGATDAGIELIEHGLDQDIVSLEPVRREGLQLPDHTLLFSDKGLRTAKTYRDDYPRTAQNTLIEESIRQAFSTLVDSVQAD